MLSVLLGTGYFNKCVESFKFQNDSPILKYCQQSLNSCCFSSLASAFDSINYIKDINAIPLRIEESLESEVGNRIDFANDILKKKKGETKLHYNLIKYKNKGLYKILEDISKHATLFKLMDSLRNVNHAISFVGYLIF